MYLQENRGEIAVSMINERSKRKERREGGEKRKMRGERRGEERKLRVRGENERDRMGEAANITQLDLTQQLHT